MTFGYHDGMSRLPVRLFLLGVLVVVAGMATGARCYPPDTRVVVFIQGLYTTFDTETQSTILEGPRFTTLKEAFLDGGYDERDLLDFSYAGGQIRNGEWEPAPYPCEDTDRPADESLAVLEEMLRDVHGSRDRVHFTLVGHSLGGYLAFLEADREAARADDDKLDIDVIVTLDSPLLGVDADKKAIIDNIPCEKTYIAGAEIVAQKLDPDISVTRAQQAARMAEAGIRLGTYGNLYDCLWNTSHCLPGSGFIDDSQTQYVGGAAERREYRIDGNPFASHDAILAHAPAVADVIAFVGEP